MLFGLKFIILFADLLFAVPFVACFREIKIEKRKIIKQMIYK